MRAAWFLLFAGCYDPAAYAPCQTACNTDTQCQPGFVCGGTGYCRSPGMGDCSPTRDAGDDADPNQVCVGRGLATACLPKPDADALADVTISTQTTFDTGDAACMLLAQASGPELCVRWFASLLVARGVTLHAVGPRPLVIATVRDLQIAGTLDAASRADQIGAGAVMSPSPLCTTPGVGSTNVAMSSASGGSAGGALVTAGGAGGEGATGSSGAGATSSVAITAVRGGCNGASGAAFDVMLGAVGGSGGGAVYLAAGGTLAVSGVINASGGGGNLPPTRTGGAGGGSGGFIGLDAATYAIDPGARIFASGGSGSTGGGMDDPGFAGKIATPTSDPVGPSSTEAGSGGNGGSLTVGGSGGASTLGGGGGGGGGGGYIGIAGSGVFVGPTFRPPAKAM